MEVQIAKDIEPLVPNYLNNRRDDADKLRLAVANRDLASVARIGHRMKGNGASFGFHFITDIGMELEEAAAANDPAAAGRIVDRLCAALDELEVVFV